MGGWGGDCLRSWVRGERGRGCGGVAGWVASCHGFWGSEGGRGLSDWDGFGFFFGVGWM